ncbi:MAG: hypothetical protein U9R19_06205 [Bacteroidota bacterium]|nr:hypothetical protein [Bacteroidota bacterium]
MKLNTKQKANSIKSRFLVFAFLTIILVAILFLTDFVKQKEIPIAVLVAGVIVYIYYMIKKFTYILYDDDGDKIILRYFNLVPSTLDHHSIEIPKQTFMGYETKSVFYGMREDITLIQKTKNGTAKYPSVSLAILNNTEKKLLIKSLSELAKGKA